MDDSDKLVSVHDKYGNEYACPLNVIKQKLIKKEDLTEQQLKKCFELDEVISGSHHNQPLLDG
jgi:hypothetical protein